MHSPDTRYSQHVAIHPVLNAVLDSDLHSVLYSKNNFPLLQVFHKESPLPLSRP